MEIRDTICASHVEDSTFHLWHIQTPQIKLLLLITKMTGIFQSEKWSHFLAFFFFLLSIATHTSALFFYLKPPGPFYNAYYAEG